MSIFVVGINHKTAPVSLREKIYFSLEKVGLYLQDILNRGIAREAVLLSTCNRSELYCEATDSSGIYEWFCEQASAEIGPSLYIYRDEDAVAHIMQVACGLDSMIVGESQILGQMKAAFSESTSVGTVDSTFHRLFQQVFSVAKEVRSATAIGACPVSVASAAVHFSQQHIDLNHAEVAIIGAGDMSELLLRYLQKHLKTPVTLINRNLEKAAALSSKVFALDDLKYALTNIDIVFTATGSPTPIITEQNLAPVLANRTKPLYLIDMAVPRDIDPAVVNLQHAKLFCIDDLKAIIEKNRQGREHAATKAQGMILAKSKEFIREHQSLDKVAHTIRAYRGQIEEICQAELRKAQQQLRLGNDPANVMDSFAKAFINKLMHTPSVQLRQAGQEGRFELLHFAKKLFAIPDAETETT